MRRALDPMCAQEDQRNLKGLPRRGCVSLCLMGMRYLVGGLVTLAIVGYFLFGELIRFFSPGPDGSFAETLALSELCAQLRLPFGTLALFGTVALLALAMWRTAFACFVVTAVALFPLWRLRPTVALIESRPPGALRMVAGNVLSSNPRTIDVFEAIAGEGPDVIALVEVTVRWRRAALERFGGEYSFHASGSDRGEWKKDACGQLLLSRVPILSTRVLKVQCDGVAQRPVIEAVLDWQGAPLTVHLIHPLRPTLAHRVRARLATFEQVVAAGVAAEMRGERVVIGDFNTTSSSPLFARLTRGTGLRDSRVGFGVLPTYTPSHPLMKGCLPFGWKPSVTIDHALISSGLNVIERGTLDLPGSDHRGVTMTIVRVSET